MRTMEHLVGRCLSRWPLPVAAEAGAEGGELGMVSL